MALLLGRKTLVHLLTFIYLLLSQFVLPIQTD